MIKYETDFERFFCPRDKAYSNFWNDSYLETIFTDRKTPTVHYDNEGNATVELELPGVKKEDIEIVPQGKHIAVSFVDRNGDKLSTKIKLIDESYYDVENITAKLDLGILILFLKKAESKSQKKIVIV